MKSKEYHTVRTIPLSDRQIVKTQENATSL